MTTDAPARRTPNTSMTEADWREAMRMFLAGATDAEIARRFDLSPSTVAAQRFKRGVYRKDRPVAALRRPGRRPSPERVAAGEAAVAGGGGPMLVLPEADDPQATASALLAFSRALAGDARMAEAANAARLARSFLLTARLGSPAPAGEGGAGEDDRPDPPVLRLAQRPPEGTEDGAGWRTWLFLGGRGAGKTLAGAAWLARAARRVERLALVGPSVLDVREVMIEGPSGLRGLASAFGPEGARPRYEPSRRRLLWPNGAVAHVFSAEDPDGLRGPQFAAAWADEVCAWPQPSHTLALLRMGLRLGEEPKLVLTTTPRPSSALRDLLAEAGLAVTRGSAAQNAAHLAPGFLEELRQLYGGTRLERQELDGEVLEEAEGAVFRRADLERARAAWAQGVPERFDRVVVAVDPPAGLDGAACGLVVVARSGGRFWVLEDRTIAGFSPLGWAQRACLAADEAQRRGPVSVVAEANQGGEMVRSVLATAGLQHPLRLVHASQGKAARAEPVALLYEQGRVAHAPRLDALEDQLLLLGAAAAARGPSPDRADALVWALTALSPLGGETGPRMRAL